MRRRSPKAEALVVELVEEKRKRATSARLLSQQARWQHEPHAASTHSPHHLSFCLYFCWLSQEAEDARLEKERIEREEAGKDITNGIEQAKATRDAAPAAPAEERRVGLDKASKLLDKPIKRAKKAGDFPAEALGEAGVEYMRMRACFCRAERSADDCFVCWLCGSDG